MDKKQKILFGVLAVLVVASGGRWYVGSSGDSSDVIAKREVFKVKERKARVVDKSEKHTRSWTTTQKKVVAKQAVELKKITQKNQRSGSKGKEKKKKTMPVA